MSLLTRVGGETFRLFAELGVQVDLGVAAARSALDGLVAPSRSSATCAFVLVGHAPSFPDSRCDVLHRSLVRLVDGAPAPQSAQLLPYRRVAPRRRSPRVDHAVVRCETQ